MVYIGERNRQAQIGAAARNVYSQYPKGSPSESYIRKAAAEKGVNYEDVRNLLYSSVAYYKKPRAHKATPKPVETSSGTFRAPTKQEREAVQATIGGKTVRGTRAYIEGLQKTAKEEYLKSLSERERRIQETLQKQQDVAGTGNKVAVVERDGEIYISKVPQSATINKPFLRELKGGVSEELKNIPITREELIESFYQKQENVAGTGKQVKVAASGTYYPLVAKAGPSATIRKEFLPIVAKEKKLPAQIKISELKPIDASPNFSILESIPKKITTKEQEAAALEALTKSKVPLYLSLEKDTSMGYYGNVPTNYFKEYETAKKLQTEVSRKVVGFGLRDAAKEGAKTGAILFLTAGLGEAIPAIAASKPTTFIGDVYKYGAKLLMTKPVQATLGSIFIGTQTYKVSKDIKEGDVRGIASTALETSAVLGGISMSSNLQGKPISGLYKQYVKTPKFSAKVSKWYKGLPKGPAYPNEPVKNTIYPRGAEYSPQRDLYGKAISQPRISKLRAQIEEQVIFGSKLSTTDKGLIKTGSIEKLTTKPAKVMGYKEPKTPRISERTFLAKDSVEGGIRAFPESQVSVSDQGIFVYDKGVGQFVEGVRYTGWRTITPKISRPLYAYSDLSKQTTLKGYLPTSKGKLTEPFSYLKTQPKTKFKINKPVTKFDFTETKATKPGKYISEPQRPMTQQETVALQKQMKIYDPYGIVSQQQYVQYPPENLFINQPKSTGDIFKAFIFSLPTKKTGTEGVLVPTIETDDRQTIYPIIAPSQKLSPLSKLSLRSQPDTTMAPITIIEPSIKTDIQPLQVIDPITTVTPITEPKQDITTTPVPLIVTSTITGPPPPPPPNRTPKKPTFDSLDDQQKRNKVKLVKPILSREQGYNVLVKRKQLKIKKGKYKSSGYKQINKKPLTRLAALGRGAEIVDAYTNRSFKVVKAKRAAIKNKRLEDKWAMLKNKFRIAKKNKNRIVEKSKHAIDSYYEKMGIPYESIKQRRLGLLKMGKKPLGKIVKWV